MTSKPVRQHSVIRQCVAEIRRALLVVAFLGSVMNILQLTVPLYMLQVFDRVLTSRSMETLILLTALAAVGLITLAALQAVTSRITAEIGAWVDRRLSVPLLAASAASIRETTRSAQLLADLSTVRRYLGGPAVISLLDTMWAPAFLIIVFALHPLLGSIILIAMILTLALSLLEARGGRTEQDAPADIALNAEAAHSMGMMPTLAQSCLEDRSERIAKQLEVSRRRSTYDAIEKFLKSGLNIAILCAGVILVTQSELTLGGMIAASILGRRAASPFGSLVKAVQSTLEARQAYRSLQAALEVAPSPAVIDDPRDLGCSGLTVQDLQYFRSSSRTAGVSLRRVNFTVEPGEMLAIVGPSGSGKSTLARLIVGLLEPRSGRILLDGTPVNGWGPDVRAVHVGYLPQQPQFFDGTIRDNIGRLQLANRDVFTAAERIGAHQAIIDLPQGYNTPLRAAGGALPNGLLQRISIARAICGDPHLVVLDEPTAHLDHGGEKVLFSLIESLKAQQAIVIVVTHRAEVIRQSDTILKLPDAKLRNTAEALARQSSKARSPEPARSSRGNASQGRKAAAALRVVGAADNDSSLVDTVGDE